MVEEDAVETEEDAVETEEGLEEGEEGLEEGEVVEVEVLGLRVVKEDSGAVVEAEACRGDVGVEVEEEGSEEEGR